MGSKSRLRILAILRGVYGVMGPHDITEIYTVGYHENMSLLYYCK